MGSAHSDVEHRMLVSRIIRIVCRPSKLALRNCGGRDNTQGTCCR